MKRVLVTIAAVMLLAGCAASEPVATDAPATSTPAAPVETTAPPSATPIPAPAEIVITFYGSDIQVIGSTYDDTPTVEDLGRVADGYQIVIPPGVGFSWGAVSWNGANDAGCRVTQGDVVLLENAAPNQLSAQCQSYDGF